MTYPRYKFYLDSIEIDQPQGWDKMEEGINRKDEEKSILITQNVPLEFVGTGYTHLKQKESDEGWNSLSEFLVKESCNQDGIYEDAITGIIFTSDVEFDLEQCIAKAKIQDNSYYAKIYNNKSLEFLMHVGKSKSNTVISPATITQTHFFRPSDGSYYGILSGTDKERSSAGYRIYDVLKYLVSAMTDDEVGFESTTFDTGGIYEGAWLTCGMVIRRVQSGLSLAEFENIFPKISWSKAMQELDRKHNIGVWVELSNGQPVIRVEDLNYYFNHAVVLTLNNIKGITQSTDVNKLYSKVVFGSNNVLHKSNTSLNQLSFPEDISFVGFKKEEYIIISKANIDRTLDLSCEWITSSNIIEDVVINGNKTHDSKIFLIYQNVGSPYQCSYSNWITNNPPPYYYNEKYINANVAQRYLGGIPSAIADYLSAITPNLFRAQFVASTPGVVVSIPSQTGAFCGPIRYDDDVNAPNNDADNKYNPATGEYEAQSGGLYYFSGHTLANVFVPNTDNAQVSATITEVIRVYDNAGFAGGNLISEVQVSQYTPPFVHGSNGYSVTGSVIVNMDAGHKAVHGFIVDGYDGNGINDITFLIDTIHSQTSFWEVTQTVVSNGGIFNTYDPNNYPVNIFKFKKPLTKAQWEMLKASPNKLIKFDDGRNFFKAWVGPSVNYNRLSGNTDFTLIANKKLL